MSQPVLLGVGGLLLVFFLWRLFQGVVSRTVAIPAGLAAGLAIAGLGLHPGLAVVGALVTYTIVTKVVRWSLRWAGTIVVLGAVAALGWGLQTGRLALG